MYLSWRPTEAGPGAGDEPDQGLLANQGVVGEVSGDFLGQVDQVRLWDGRRLPAGLRARLVREWTKVALLTEQIAAVEAERQAALRTAEVERVRQRLRGSGAAVPGCT